MRASSGSMLVQFANATNSV